MNGIVNTKKRVAANAIGNTDALVRRWFPGIYSQPNARLRIFAFPFAGGDISAFYHWHEWLPKDVELIRVQLPERGLRQNEIAPDSIQDLVEQLLIAFIHVQDRPYTFFGYSMGGLIAYVIILRLIERGLERPRLFCVGACNPPHLRRHAWDAMSDKTLVNLLTKSDPSWMRVIPSKNIHTNLRLIRKDLLLCHAFLKKSNPSMPMVDCPIATFGGQQDNIARPEDILDWRGYTSASCVSHRLEGGHFFLLDAERNQLPKILLRELQQLERKLEH